MSQLISHRQRSRLGDEVLEVYALYERSGATELQEALEHTKWNLWHGKVKGQLP